MNPDATKGAATAFFGGATTILGEMANLTGEEWSVLLLVVFFCMIAGNMAALGFIANHKTNDELIKARRLRVAVFLAQFLFGVVIAAQFHGNIWLTIPPCLAVGWTGTQFLEWLAKRSGFGGNE